MSNTKQRAKILKSIEVAFAHLEDAIQDVEQKRSSVEVIQLRLNDMHVALNHLAASYFKTWALPHTN